MKRVFDITFSAVGLLLLMPVLSAIALLILIFDGVPVLFFQERIGQRGKPFRIWKFRTMVCDAERLGKSITVGRDPRITRLGYWLRKTKVDEFPQLWNVLVGEMSFVGPRPEVPRYANRYTAQQSRVLDLKPGLTDPASIRFRNESELLQDYDDPERIYMEVFVPEKIRINLAYAERANLLRDCLVIFRSITALISPTVR
jgi:lipopolysaccharide/colanic/teichoic acid biosynthesis glycosyltransferase